MKIYLTSKDLVKDFKSSLKKDNAFDKYIMDRLSNLSTLVREFREYPNLTLGDRKGNWFFIWKNNVIEIDKSG